MWKIRKLDEQLFDGAAAKIHEFLDIELLMPPGRLRLSKLLGRPVIDDIMCDCLGAAFIDECRNVDCTISCVYQPQPGWRWTRWMGHTRDAPVRQIACVHIVSDEDTEFGKAWYAKHDAYWPHTKDGVHPMLRCRQLSEEWKDRWNEYALILTL